MTTAPFVELQFNPTDLRPGDLPKGRAFLGSPAEALEAALAVSRTAVADQVKTELRGLAAPTQAQLLRIVDLAWQTVFWRFRKISAPIMADAYLRAYTSANAGDVPTSVLYELADKHAEKIGDYFHQTSRQGLADGFNTLVNRRIPAKAAADRVLEAYGLSPRQMRAYVSASQFSTPVSDVMPRSIKAKAVAYIDKAFTSRTHKLAQQEEHNINEQAKQFAWMWLQDKKRLSTAAQKLWITAKDERVCPVCGPLHGQKVGVNEKFKTKDGDFWTPGLHPNCRCVVRLIENKFTPESDSVSKAYDAKQKRDQAGRWTKSKSAQQAKGKLQPKPYQITEDDIEHYTAERCNDLAMEIHQRTGWPVYGVFHYDEDKLNENWWHTGVLTPDGKWLDVRGKQEMEDVANDWSEFLYEEGDVDLLPVKDFGTDDGTKVTPRAKQVADALLAEYGDVSKADAWNPKEHPRGGDPENKGRFSSAARSKLAESNEDIELMRRTLIRTAEKQQAERALLEEMADPEPEKVSMTRASEKVSMTRPGGKVSMSRPEKVSMTRPAEPKTSDPEKVSMTRPAEPKTSDPEKVKLRVGLPKNKVKLTHEQMREKIALQRGPEMQVAMRSAVADALAADAATSVAPRAIRRPRMLIHRPTLRVQDDNGHRYPVYAVVDERDIGYGTGSRFRMNNDIEFSPDLDAVTKEYFQRLSERETKVWDNVYHDDSHMLVDNKDPEDVWTVELTDDEIGQAIAWASMQGRVQDTEWGNRNPPMVLNWKSKQSGAHWERVHTTEQVADMMHLSPDDFDIRLLRMDEGHDSELGQTVQTGAETKTGYETWSTGGIYESYAHVHSPGGGIEVIIHHLEPEVETEELPLPPMFD